MLKSIAVMTSGGDSPGMNAAVRAVTRTALHQGVKVWGIRGGYHGMLDEDMFEMQSLFSVAAHFWEQRAADVSRRRKDVCSAIKIL